MKKVNGEIIEACALCNHMYDDVSRRDNYCAPLHDAGQHEDCRVELSKIRVDCPLPDAFTDRDEMADMIRKLYEGGPGTIYAEAREWLLKEGMVEPWECEEK